MRTENGPSPLLIYKDWERIRAHGMNHAPEIIRKIEATVAPGQSRRGEYHVAYGKSALAPRPNRPGQRTIQMHQMRLGICRQATDAAHLQQMQ